MPIQIFCLLLNQIVFLLSCKSSLSILATSLPVSDICCASIFSQFIKLLFSSYEVSKSRIKKIKSSLPIFSFIVCFSCSNRRFSSRCFVFCGYVYLHCSFFPYWYLIVPASCVEDTILSPLNYLYVCWKATENVGGPYCTNYLYVCPNSNTILSWLL